MSTVLFAGGPLHGQTMAVPDTARNVYAEESLSLDGPASPVLYAIAKLVLCGRMILVGHLGAEPDEALVFEVLTSDGAKEASEALALAERLV